MKTILGYIEIKQNARKNNYGNLSKKSFDKNGPCAVVARFDGPAKLYTYRASRNSLVAFAKQ